MNFIEELLEQAAVAEQEQRLEMNRLRADQLLAAIAVLETKQAEVNALADEEAKLIEQYRQAELERLQKKVRWLSWNLGQFMTEHHAATQEKTLTLPHGQLKLRQQRDKVEVTDVELFMKVGPKYGLVRQVPEYFEPDLQAVIKHIKTTGEVPPGVSYIDGAVKFSYTTIKGDNHESERKPSKVGTAVERNGNGQALEG